MLCTNPAHASSGTSLAGTANRKAPSHLRKLTGAALGANGHACVAHFEPRVASVMDRWSNDVVWAIEIPVLEDLALVATQTHSPIQVHSATVVVGSVVVHDGV